MKKPRVLVADDHSFIIQGISNLLEHDYEIVGRADNGKDLVDLAFKLQPDIVVLDISMPILNGIEATREIKRTLPSTKVIILTMHSNAIYVRKALEAGASGYVLKAGATEELITAIQETLKGNTYLTPSFDDSVREQVGLWRNRPVRSPIELTSRQRQILQLVAEGKRSKEIADILHVSAKTVDFHRARLMTKLGVRNIAGLTAFAIQEGLASGAEVPSNSAETD